MFIIIVGILAIAYGIFELFFAGEKYYNWYFRSYGKDSNNYNIPRVKLVRGISLILLGLTCFFIDFFVDKCFWVPAIIALLVVITHSFAVFFICKK